MCGLLLIRSCFICQLQSMLSSGQAASRFQLAESADLSVGSPTSLAVLAARLDARECWRRANEQRQRYLLDSHIVYEPRNCRGRTTGKQMADKRSAT